MQAPAANIVSMASLASSNRHLSTRSKREDAVRVTIATSSAIEGIRAPFKVVKVVRKAGAVKAANKSGKSKPQASDVRKVRRTTALKTASIGE